MSYRPTISVYFNRHIADNGYYRNWNDKDLFYEAIAIASLYGDCNSIEEYRERKYGCQKVYRIIAPEIIEDTEENLMELEQCSEFPIIVDMTAKCIYSNYGALTWKEIAKIPSILDDHDVYGYRKVLRKVENYDELAAENERMWKDNIGWDKIRIWERSHPLYKYFDEPVKFSRISVFTDFGLLMEKCRIPFGHIDLNELRILLNEWEDAPYHLSKDVMEHLRNLN